MRFDLMPPPVDDPAEWARTAGDARRRGYTGLLRPDVPGAGDPLRALAHAADREPELRVGTYVLAAAAHEPARLAARVVALARETGGRFDLGIGTGRPDLRTAAGPSGRVLRDRVAEVITRVRDAAPDTPVTVAASGPKGLALAGRLADALALALPPEADEAGWAAAAGLARAAATRPVGLTVNLLAVGDTVAAWHARRYTGESLRAMRSLPVLPAGRDRAAAVLEHWRAHLGVTRIVVDASLRAAIQPLLDA
jgi:alkanesulfonate monooxygenase SsuD/methylene tetrahydromethanopterin reductase-like flavin-dependent oxidoreductase (luciferase family)